MGAIGGVGGYHANVSGDCGQCSNIGAVSANVTNMSCSGWDPIGQTCNISVYTITADCQFRSESPAFAVVHLTCTLSLHATTCSLSIMAMIPFYSAKSSHNY